MYHVSNRCRHRHGRDVATAPTGWVGLSWYLWLDSDCRPDTGQMGMEDVTEVIRIRDWWARDSGYAGQGQAFCRGPIQSAPRPGPLEDRVCCDT